METNKELQNLIGAILKKDYFKLEFGCKVKLNESDGEYIFIGSNVKDYPYCFYSKNTNTIINTNYILEILGQEPTLPEILLAIQEKISALQPTKDKGIVCIWTKKSEPIYINLEKSIFNQEESVKVALIGLLEDK